MNKVDYVIVGQGLAGSFLAFQLIQQNKKVLIVDQGHDNSSSIVAAGIMNPMVLKRLTLTWRAQEFLAYNPTFFKEVEEFLGGQYYFEKPIHKLISSEEEEQFWQHRIEKAGLEPYLEKELSPSNHSIPFTNKFQLGTVKQSSWLNIKQLLIDFRTYLSKNKLILAEKFDYEALGESNYKGVQFKNLVFCEGAAAIHNPYFNHLPFSLNKGQMMTIESTELKSDTILKKKVFVLPTNANQFKVGATYAWKWENEAPNQEKQALLKAHLAEMLNIAYSVLEGSAGIRPAVKDRRPLIGRHNEHKNYFIFNGLGSRGCFMGPLLSHELIELIEHGKNLHDEVQLTRFKV